MTIGFVGLGIMGAPMCENILAKHDGAANVLEMTGDDFGRRRARAVGQHDHRLFVRHGVSGRDGKAADGAQVASLHDRPGLHEQGREHHGFAQQSSAVSAKV